MHLPAATKSLVPSLQGVVANGPFFGGRQYTLRPVNPPYHNTPTMSVSVQRTADRSRYARASWSSPGRPAIARAAPTTRGSTAASSSPSRRTRVYCRPICPVRAPKDDHIRYFPTAAAAEAAGFRPCLRCRPEASPGTPAWLGTSAVVSRALRLIGEGSLDEDGVDALAGRLGMTARHLRRLFLQHLGATPVEVAHTRRVHFAKKLLDETALAFSQVAFASGFGSVRRFNSQIRRTYARTPTELRRLARQRVVADPECYRFRLAYRPPYDWAALLAFLNARATPGVESVEQSRYRRTITVDGAHGAIDVSRAESGPALCLEVRFPDPRALLFIVERVRRMFDLGADPAVIAEHLRADPLLRKPLAGHPGIRVPGAWDGFELAVRAILGQQVSVRAATTIAGRLASMFGTPVADARGLSRLFPTPAQLKTRPSNARA